MYDGKMVSHQRSFASSSTHTFSVTEDGHQGAYEVPIEPVSRVVRRNGTLIAKWRRRGLAAWLSSWEAAIMLSFGSFVLGLASYRRGRSTGSGSC
jgi:hypothetical protein